MPLFPGSISNLKFIQLLDSRPNGTTGGSAVVGIWSKRVINTIAIDEVGSTSLNGNIFTLDSGTYAIDVLTTYYKSGYIKTRLFNVTNNIAVPNCESVNGYNASESCSFSHLKGKFTLASRQQLSIEYRVHSNSGGATALGEACSFGQNEVFLLANIWKIS